MANVSSSRWLKTSPHPKNYTLSHSLLPPPSEDEGSWAGDDFSGLMGDANYDYDCVGEDSPEFNPFSGECQTFSSSTVHGNYEDTHGKDANIEETVMTTKAVLFTNPEAGLFSNQESSPRSVTEPVGPTKPSIPSKTQNNPLCSVSDPPTHHPTSPQTDPDEDPPQRNIPDEDLNASFTQNSYDLEEEDTDVHIS
ncbi:hypothetical protein LXL04_009346 [Taraxacum kok-saghyz]